MTHEFTRYRELQWMDVDVGFVEKMTKKQPTVRSND
jgi:hypothetical protein